VALWTHDAATISPLWNDDSVRGSPSAPIFRYQIFLERVPSALAYRPWDQGPAFGQDTIATTTTDNLPASDIYGIGRLST